MNSAQDANKQRQANRQREQRERNVEMPLGPFSLASKLPAQLLCCGVAFSILEAMLTPVGQSENSMIGVPKAEQTLGSWFLLIRLKRN